MLALLSIRLRSLLRGLAHVLKDMYPHLKIYKYQIFVTGGGRRYDPHELEGASCGIAVCCSFRDIVSMDTVWGGYVGRQESQNQWPGCRLGYWKQEGAQWTGNLLYAENI